MRSRRAKWSIAVFAVLLNLGGGPMAWAHLLNGGCHEHAVPAASADCPDHAAPQSAPCCDGGSCSCAVPALSVDLGSGWTRVPFVSSSVPLDTASLPSHLPDDTLRPPIR